MADLVRLQAIKDELEIDPETLGYTAPNAGVEADAITDANLMNAVNRVVERESLSGSEIFESIVRAEYEVLTAEQKEQVRVILSLGDNIQIGTGTTARSWMLDAFDVGTTTRSNLQTIASQTVSRATELGFGNVSYGDIQNARLV